MVFLCNMTFELDRRTYHLADTLGMLPCPRCGQLSYDEHPPGCDRSPQEVEEEEEEERDLNRPDADADEVAVMLGATPWLEFRDPTELYEGETEDDAWLQ